MTILYHYPQDSLVKGEYNVGMNCRFCPKEIKPALGRRRGFLRYACSKCVKELEMEMLTLKKQTIRKRQGLTDSKI